MQLEDQNSIFFQRCNISFKPVLFLSKLFLILYPSCLKGVFSKPSGDYIVVPNFCFFEVETSNFGSSYVFSSLLNLRGQILPNLTFWTQKWHISLKSRYRYSEIFVSWDKCMTWNMQFLTFKCQVRKNLTPLSLWAPKNMAVAKISCFYLKRQRFWNNGT